MARPPSFVPPFRHEVVAPNLHRFVFASASRPGVTHELMLDLDARGEERFSCLCEAGLRGRSCKHRAAVVEWLRSRGVSA